MIARARAAAFQILLKVSTTDGHSDELLRAAEIGALSAQDRGLTTTLVLGTLRWQLKLDQRIRALLARPNAKLSLAVEMALHLGAYQLLYLDRIPAHAAIGESVELAKQAGEIFAAGMVNAVLRKLAREPREAANEAPKNVVGVAEAYAHPQWMVTRWAGFYGLETAAAICRADQEPTAMHLRLVHPDAERSLLDDGVEFEAGEFLVSARRVLSGDVLRSAAFERRWIRIQDEGSQLVGELAGHGSKILDTCAAPGGKTSILAERNPEAEITAYDVSRRRLEAMRRSFSDSVRVRFEVQDVTAVELQPEYDLILCDVPCTGTGTMGRNPEIRLRVSEEEIARQHVRQMKILACAFEGLAPGGRLLYSTCSLEREENEAVVNEVLAKRGDFRVVALEEEAERLEREGVLHAKGAARLKKNGLQQGFLRTIPGVNRCDGFFAALFTRN